MIAMECSTKIAIWINIFGMQHEINPTVAEVDHMGTPPQNKTKGDWDNILI